MKELVSFLKENKLTIGSVESMTGGLFASEITTVPGASKVFKGSIVSYSRLIKENIVQISPELIDEFGVVSKEVAEKMAANGRLLLGVDVCVSITGNAGPTTEPGDEDVGVCYIGVATQHQTVVYREKFSGERNEIRQQSVLAMQEAVMKEKKF